MEQITTVGIDLAKSVFSLHGVDGAGRVVLRRTVRRDQLVATVAALSPCLIGIEACSGAHEWGRRFQGLGHTVRLMAPTFVAPYRKSGKNDGNDAEAICEAVTRPNMRFVPVKSAEQQALLALHRVRHGFAALALPPHLPLSPRWAMPGSSRTAGSSPRGSVSPRANTPPAASRVWVTSASGAMRTSATCSFRARARCSIAP